MSSVLSSCCDASMLWNMHKKIFELIMVEEHAKNAVVQEACKKGHNVDYVVVKTDISKIDFPKGSVVESHDAGMYKNEDVYRMLFSNILDPKTQFFYEKT